MRTGDDAVEPASAGAPPGPAAGAAAAVCAALGVPLMLVFDGGAPLVAGVVPLLAAVAAAAVFLVPRVAVDDTS